MRAAIRFSALAVLLAGAARAQVASPQKELRVTASAAPVGHAEVLASVDALPAHIASNFRGAAAFTQSPSGTYFVLDQRDQAVYAIDKAKTDVTRVVQVGPERGRIIRPTAFASQPGGGFLVADLPERAARIQRFADRGYLLNGFTLPGPTGGQVTASGFAAAGIRSMQSTGDSIFVSRPQDGALVEEYSWNGQMLRSFGALRATGQEADQSVHLALNVGLPLVDPNGGFCFVFQAGVPLFRRYDAGGQLQFERHIEGRELDQTLATQPSVWPKRRAADGTEVPAVPLVVRTAALDPHGRLWVVLADGPIYVYSREGDKVRTLRLRAAGPLSPTSLFFASESRLLVTPGCYIFDVSGIVR